MTGTHSTTERITGRRIVKYRYFDLERVDRVISLSDLATLVLALRVRRSDQLRWPCSSGRLQLPPP